jgi:hypothetical protein
MYFSIRDRGDGYCLDNFVQALLWRPRPQTCTQQRRITHDAMGSRALPSWSWAGWLVPAEIEDTDTWSGYERGFHILKPFVLDESNVVCFDMTGGQVAPWKFEGEPCKIDPRDGIVLHLWVPVLSCVLRHDSNLPRWQGFDMYQILVGGNCIGQIELHDSFLLALRNQASSGNANDTLSKTASKLDLEGEWNVEMLLFWRQRKSTSTQRRGKMMLVRTVGEYKERMGLSEYVESEEDVFLDVNVYQHIKLI